MKMAEVNGAYSTKLTNKLLIFLVNFVTLFQYEDYPVRFNELKTGAKPSTSAENRLLYGLTTELPCHSCCSQCRHYGLSQKLSSSCPRQFNPYHIQYICCMVRFSVVTFTIILLRIFPEDFCFSTPVGYLNFYPRKFFFWNQRVNKMKMTQI